MHQMQQCGALFHRVAHPSLRLLARGCLKPGQSRRVSGRTEVGGGHSADLIGLVGQVELIFEEVLDRLDRNARGPVRLHGEFFKVRQRRGIAVLDELAEAEDRIEALKQDIADLTTAGRELTIEAEELEQKFARRLSEAARKVEAIAQAIDETGAPAAN